MANAPMIADPAQRGHHAAYHEHQTNHCPGCGRTHWLIGRQLAECAFCSTALPLAQSLTRGWARPLIRNARTARAA